MERCGLSVTKRRAWRRDQKYGFWHWAHIPALPLKRSVAADQLLNLSVPFWDGYFFLTGLVKLGVMHLEIA